jgi:hypothetical protein
MLIYFFSSFSFFAFLTFGVSVFSLVSLSSFLFLDFFSVVGVGEATVAVDVSNKCNNNGHLVVNNKIIIIYLLPS